MAFHSFQLNRRTELCMCVCVCVIILSVLFCVLRCVFFVFIFYLRIECLIYLLSLLFLSCLSSCVCARSLGSYCPPQKSPTCWIPFWWLRRVLTDCSWVIFLVLVIVLYYKVVVCARYQIRIIVFWSKPCLILPFKQYFCCGCCIQFGTC